MNEPRSNKNDPGRALVVFGITLLCLGWVGPGTLLLLHTGAMSGFALIGAGALGFVGLALLGGGIMTLIKNGSVQHSDSKPPDQLDP